ncbi:MAG: O-antigen ligase family protein [Candidatus Xenobia bacterium]
MTRWRPVLASYTTLLRGGMLLGSLVVVLASPWFFSNADDDNFGPFVVMGSGLLLVLAGVLPLVRGVTWPRHATPFLGFLGWCTLATWSSLAPFHSHRELAVWLTGGAIYLGIILAQPGSAQLRNVTLALTTGIAALGACSLLAAHGASMRLGTLTFANSDCFAALALMALLVGAGLLPLKRPWLNIALLAELLVLLAAVLATGSRSAMLGLAGGTVVLLAFHTRRRRWPIGPTLVAGVLVVGTVVLLCWALAGSTIENRWSESFQTDDQAWSVRRMVLHGAPQTVARHPLLGSGPGNFALAFEEDRPYGTFKGYVNQGHMDLMQVAVEEGVPGILLFLIALGVAVGDSWSAPSAGASGPAAALTGATLYGFTNFALPVPADLAFYCALLALGTAWSNCHAKPAASPRRAGWLAACPVALVAAFWAFNVGSRTLQTWHSDAAVQAAEQAYHWNTALHQAEAACAAEPDDEWHHLVLGELLDKLGQLRGSRLLVLSAREEMYKALALNPRGKGLARAVAQMEERSGNPDKARAILLEATRLYPEDPGNWVELARVWLTEQRPTLAAECMWRAARDDDNNMGGFTTLVALLQVSKGSGGALLERLAAGAPTAQRTLLAQLALQAARSTEDHTDAALALLKTALALQPHNPEVALYMARTVLCSDGKACLQWLHTASQYGGPPVAQSISDMFAQSSPGPGCKGALVLLQSWLAERPDDNHARITLAHLYMQQNALPEAIGAFEEATSRDSQNAPLFAELAAAYMKNGEKQKALDAYREALQLDPGNQQLESLVGRLEAQ